jgi:hypothetical protein
MRGVAARIFPLVRTDGVETYLGAAGATALVLESAGLLGAPVVDLRGFAALAAGPLVTVGARARGAA